MDFLTKYKGRIVGWIAAIAVALTAIAAMTPTDKDDKAAALLTQAAETLQETVSDEALAEPSVE